jgi:ABC-type lipoprotein export system ATPase subunit
MNTAVLTADAVDKSYGAGSARVAALVGINLELAAGELVALVGPSGSGKSSLLNILCGWETPDRGRVSWAGSRRSMASLKWSELAIVPQALGLLDELSVRENVALPARFGSAGPSELVITPEGLLETFGLTRLAARSPAQTSLGEQQRTAVARALLLAPQLVLADEPSAHQDARWVEAVFAALRAAADRGAACLVATHSTEALSYTDRVVAIRGGRLESA